MYGSMVKRLRHRPFTAVTGVQIPLESFQQNSICADVAQLAEQLICNQQVIGSSPIIGFLRDLDLQLSWLEQPAHNRSVLGSSPRRSIKLFYWKNVRIWPSGSVGQSVALSRRRSSVRVRSGSLMNESSSALVAMGSQLSWESICLTSRGSQVRALQVPL